MLARIENDYYPTKNNIVSPLLEIINISGNVLEPCAGSHDIAQYIDDCITNDLHDYPDIKQDFNLDASLDTSWQEITNKYPIDWVITNPPFNNAHKILPLAYKHARVGVIFMMRLSYIEPCSNRARWLKRHADSMTHLIPINPRPIFRDEGGTDNVTVAWYVWQKKHSWRSLGIDCPFKFITDWR